MAKYIIDESTLKNLANAIRKVNGEVRSYTPTEMIEAVTHIMESTPFILVDEDGYEIPAVYVDNETVFTATANDIRIGTVAATESGVTEGTKEIPAYYVWEGTRIVPKGSPFIIPSTSKLYDYTKLQALVCKYNTSQKDSVATSYVALLDNVYAVNSTVSVASITKNENTYGIELGITNDSDGICILRYFLYKEMY